jgi:hypothetical protein
MSTVLLLEAGADHAHPGDSAPAPRGSGPDGRRARPGRERQAGPLHGVPHATSAGEQVPDDLEVLRRDRS